MSNVLSKEHVSIFCNVLNINNEDEIEQIYINPGRSAYNNNHVFVANG